MAIDIKQISPSGAPDGGQLQYNSSTGLWEAIPRVKTVETYTWFQDTISPFIEFKGITYTIQDRIIFPGTSTKSISRIAIVAQVDAGSTGDFLLRDISHSSNIAELTGISNTDWAILNLGTITNQHPDESLIEVQIKTSAANKNMRVSSMRVEY